MTELQIFQTYWWLIIAVLGGLLVFMLFVLGGQSMLLNRLSEQNRQLLVNSLGRKWELTFTTLVLFGGACFASFPLFYSTSFGGAYWLWMLILLSFVLQAVSYEFRRRRGNLYGTRAYDFFLFFNGIVGCVLLGAAVGTFFFGGNFTVTFSNLADGSTPVISQWAPTHGLEVLTNWKCMLLGFTVFFLARTLAAQYFINNIKGDKALTASMRTSTLINGAVFAVLFVIFAIVLLTSPGYTADPDGKVAQVPYLYLHALLDYWVFGLIFLAGVVLALLGIFLSYFSASTKGIWYTGIGAVLVVIVLIGIAGIGGHCFFPSLSDPQSSLTLANASSSLFTLKVMAVVSILVPFVLAYITYVWRKMGYLTPADLDKDSHQY